MSGYVNLPVTTEELPALKAVLAAPLPLLLLTEYEDAIASLQAKVRRMEPVTVLEE